MCRTLCGVNIKTASIIVIFCMYLVLALWYIDYSSKQHTYYNPSCPGVMRYIRSTKDVHMNISASYKCVVSLLNEVLSTIRKQDIQMLQPYSNVTINVSTKAFEKDIHFIKTLSSFDNIRVISIQWMSLKHGIEYDSTSPIRQFFHPSSSWPPREVCQVANGTLAGQCAQNLNMSHVYNNVITDVAAMFSMAMPPNVHHYISVVRNAIVNEQGSVFSGDLGIFIHKCFRDKTILNPLNTHLKVHSEVFTISQDGGYYHDNVENIPRLSPFITFLQKHPSIKIHIHYSKHFENLLRMFGLHNEVIRGSVRAKLLYLPPGGGCGAIRPLNALATRQHYHHYVQKMIGDHKSSTTISDVVKHNIILIKRSSKRYIDANTHAQMNTFLLDIADRYNMSYSVFDDKSLPSFNDTVAMFSKAKLIVAPHGAGLSNMIFSPPGCTIIEVVCKPRLNGCYSNMAQKLGHHYISLLSRRENCGPMSISFEYFSTLVNKALFHVKTVLL